MVDFAELKAKAAKAKDASVTKITNTKDRYTSVPSSKTNWDPNWKATPPPASRSTSDVTAAPRGPPPLPPPQRPHLGAGSSSHGPPPVRRQTRPDAAPSPSPPPPPPPPVRAPVQQGPAQKRYMQQEENEEIDWANLSPEDKDVFFDWLDEFFSRFLNITLPPRRQSSVPIRTSHVPHISVTNHPGPPPRVNIGSKPTLSS